MEEVKLLFFNVPEKLPIVGEIYNYYQHKDGVDPHLITESSDIVKHISESKNAIVIFKVENKNDLQKAVGLLKAQRKLIRRGLLKPACFTYFKSKKVEKILAKYGCNELLDPESLRAKSFTFKIDFWSKNIRAQLKKLQQEKDYKQRGAEKKENTKEEKQEGSSDFVDKPALELQSDIWLTKHKNDNKKVLRRYLSRMLGPSPHVGKWVELEEKPGDSQKTWKFNIEDEEGQFIMEDGAWYFTGSKPEFDWKIHRWSFSSDKPHLYFYTNDGQVFSRIKFKNGKVEISENSKFALSKEEAIVETCDMKYAFENEKEQEEEAQRHKADDAEEEISHDLEGKSNTDDLGGNLKGESNSDNLGEDKIRGKMSHEHEDEESDPKRAKSQAEELDGFYGGKGKTDKIEDNPLSGPDNGIDHPGTKKDKDRSSFKEDDVGGFYDGKSKGNKIENDPLSGKSESSEEDVGGHYGGDSKTDELDRSPLKGKSSLKAREDSSNRSEYQEEELAGHYSGEGKTDEVDRDPYKGSTSHKKEEARDKNSSDFNEDDLGGHYGGESSTDDFGDDSLKGKLRPNKVNPKDATNKSDFEEDDLGGHYGGESSTDEVDRDPLKGSLKPGAPKTKEGSNKSNFQEDDLGGHYDGEGSADEKDRAPLKGKLKDHKVKESGGSSRTEYGEDDLGGHYDGKGSKEEVDRDPLKGSLKAGPKNTGGSNKSEYQEDDLGGHYDNESSTGELDRAPLKGSLKPHNVKDSNGKDKTDHEEDARGESALVDELGEPVREDESDDNGELDRDALSAETKKNEAANLSDSLADDEEGIDELNRDGLAGGLKAKKKVNPSNPKATNEEEGIDELDRDGSASGLKARKNENPLSQRESDGEEGVEELERGSLSGSLKPKMNKPHSEEDNSEEEGIDELSRDSLGRALKPERKATAKVAPEKNMDEGIAELEREGLSGQLKPNSTTEKTETNTANAVEKETNELERSSLSASLKPEKKKTTAGENKELDKAASELNRDGEDLLSEPKKEQAAKSASKDGDSDNVKELDRDGLDKVVSDKNPGKASNLTPSASSDEKENQNPANKESEIKEALGGNLTDDSTLDPIEELGLKAKIIGAKLPDEDEQSEGDAIEDASKKVIENKFEFKEPDINTESGSMKVVTKVKQESGEDLDVICGFEDFFPDELVVIGEKEQFPIGAEVSATVKLNYNGKNIDMKVKGKVVEIDEYLETGSSVSVELEAVSEEEYERFMDLYQDRQENISEFMKLAKGYE